MWFVGVLEAVGVMGCEVSMRSITTTPHNSIKKTNIPHKINRVAFFDATNTTQARRQKLLERNRRESKAVSLIFVESLCDDPNVLHRNYQLKLQNNGGGVGRVCGFCVYVGRRRLSGGRRGHRMYRPTLSQIHRHHTVHCT